MNAHSKIGDNGPPSPIDPIEAVTAEYEDVISEAQNWTDGEPVTDEAGMKAVDAIIKDFRPYRTALKKAGQERTQPLNKAWKDEVAAVKVYTDDADRIQAALAATVAPFKAKLVEEKKAAERAAWEVADKARREVEALTAKANAADLDAQREIAEAKRASIDAQKAAQAQAKDTVKGMRETSHYEITDHRAALHDIAANHAAALTQFIESFVASNHKKLTISGVRVWTNKEAY